VLVGPVAHAETSEIATFTPHGAVDLKGLGPIEIWALDEIRGTADRRRLPFVGRDAELELLRLAQRRAKTRSVLALVSGPPGQGKTRLVDEFLASWPGVRVLVARCRPGGEIGALAPLRELLLGDRPESALVAVVAEAVPEPDRARVGDTLAHSAGIRSSPALAGIGREERADEVLDAWRRFVGGLAANGPVALWVEDVHWAAPEVVALIDRLSLAGEPVLVIATARPEFAEAAGIRASGDRFFIDLDALEPDAAHALASSAGRDDVGAVARAGGNPLFIVELARARDPGGELPLTLQGALGARLDDLDATDRALLARGAVVGETFAPADAALLADRDVTGAGRALARLAERQYLDPVDGRYRFHHSLLRDVAYGRLLVADRMRLHARYARESRIDDVEVLAHHWWAALGGPEADWVWRGEEALPAMRRDAFAAHLAAGRRQAALFATERAAALSERAHSLADDERGRAEAKHALGDAYAHDLRGDESWQAYRDARSHYAATGSVPVDAYLGALKVKLRVGAFKTLPAAEESARLGAEALAAARAAGDPGKLARALVYTAFKDMDPSTAAGDPASLAEALQLAERADDETRREILGWYANDLIRDHQIERALAVLDQLETIPVALNDLDRMEHLRGRAALAEQHGDLAGWRQQAEAIVAISRRMGPHLRTHADTARSALSLAAGDWDTVAHLAAETDQLMRSSPGTPFCGAAGMLLARGAVVHARAGRADEARALVRRIDSITSGQERSPLIAAFALLFTGAGAATPPPPGPPQFRAVIAVASRQHRVALEMADQLEADARGGARFYAALAEAVREEVERDRNGTIPRHARLKEIGYVGWSELLSQRGG
jgi:hypothetical protein